MQTIPNNIGSIVANGINFNIINYCWDGNVAANHGSAVVSVTIPIGKYGMSNIYTIMSTAWGSPGLYAYLEAFGVNGAYANFQIITNYNIRDWNGGSSANLLSPFATADVFTWSTANGASTGRLDEQNFVLPSSFLNDTLSNITITDLGNYGFQRILLVALTVCNGPPITSTQNPSNPTPAPYQVSDTSATNSHSSLSTTDAGLIAGIVVFAVLFLIAMSCVVFMALHKNAKSFSFRK